MSRLPEVELGPHLPQRYRKEIGPHLSLEDVLQIRAEAIFSADEDLELAPRVVRRAEERKPLDVIPVGVRKHDRYGVELFMGGGDQVFAELPDSSAGVEDDDLALSQVTRTQLVFPPKSMNSRSGTGIDPLVP